MIEGISGIVGVPVPLVIATILALVLFAIMYNCNSSPALNERKYSTTKQFSIAAVNLILVLLSVTDVPFTTGKISR